jgi:hypothetical protein
MENRLERAGFMGCEEAAAKFLGAFEFSVGARGVRAGNFLGGRFVSACERMGATKRVGARRFRQGWRALLWCEKGQTAEELRYKLSTKILCASLFYVLCYWKKHITWKFFMKCFHGMHLLLFPGTCA